MWSVKNPRRFSTIWLTLIDGVRGSEIPLRTGGIADRRALAVLLGVLEASGPILILAVASFINMLDPGGGIGVKVDDIVRVFEHGGLFS